MSAVETREFSRRTFLKGGALVIAFTLGGTAVRSARSEVYKPVLGNYGPDISQLDTWLAIHEDGTVTLFMGIVELGTGATTGVLQLAAEELDVPFSSMRIVTPDTLRTPDQFVSSGSRAIATHGPPIRQAAAEARMVLLNLASTRLGVPASQLRVTDGVVFATSDSSKRVSYAELIGGRLFNHTIKVNGPASEQFVGTAPRKHHSEYKIVGKSIPRIDFPTLVTGQHVYVQQFHMPGMLFARVIRPPAQGAKLVKVNGFKGKPTGVVKIVRRNDWLGIVARTEWEAIVASRLIDVEWSDWSGLPRQQNLYATMRTLPLYDAAARPKDVRIGNQYKNPNPNVHRNTGNVEGALASAAKKISVTYMAPFIKHGSIGPPGAAAIWEPGDRVTVWTSTQTPYGTREAIAKFWGLPNNYVRLISKQGSGTYGQNGSDDAAVDATIFAKAVPGKPVRVQFMRPDEMGWENYKSARVYDMSGAVDATGKIVAWKSESWGFTNYGRPEYHEPAQGGEPGSLVSVQLAGWDGLTVEEGGGPQGMPSYTIPNMWGKHNFLGAPTQRDGSLRIKSGSLRNPTGFYDRFANESFVDELAHLAGTDAIDFRLRHLTDPRAIAAVRTAADAAKWQYRPSPNPDRAKSRIMRGRGITVDGAIAEIFEVAVDRKTGKIAIPRVTAVVDLGLIVNPTAVETQVEGSITQGLSQGIYEEVKFDRKTITSRDWVTYPIMRFTDSPMEINTIIINRPELASRGAGEPPHNPVLAGLTNAVFDATGVRFRQLPLTPKSVLAGLKNAGIS
jgi:CO/xanthine dehydrogenase Mo-binding subunit